jgi:hypothetical protein
MQAKEKNCALIARDKGYGEMHGSGRTRAKQKRGGQADVRASCISANVTVSKAKKPPMATAAALLSMPKALAKMSFMEKLQHILETADRELVDWSSAGDSFYVFDPQRFVRETGRKKPVFLLVFRVCTSVTLTSRWCHRPERDTADFPPKFWSCTVALQTSHRGCGS